MHCTHYDACRRETGVSPETLAAGNLSGSLRLRARRTVQTRAVSSRSVHHGISPHVYFNKLRMHVLCPAVRPFRKLPCAPDRGCQLSEKQEVIRILAPLTQQFFHQILEKQRPKKSLLSHQTQNEALEDLW